MKLKTKNKIDIAVFIAIAAAFCAVLFWLMPLPSAPALNAALPASPVYSKLLDVSVEEVSLVCLEGKVSAKFSFKKADGRAPVTVAGTENCSRSGTLVHWDGLFARAREAYAPAIVLAQLDSLLAKSGIARNQEERYNRELGALLDKKYQAQQAPAHQIRFYCEDAGDAFHYQAKYAFSEERGKVATRCQRDHEEFVVFPGKPDRHQADAGLPGFVHQYRNLSQAMVVQAYGEFLAQPALKQSF